MKTNIPKPPKVVVATENCMPWFTAGKEYPVVGIWCGWDEYDGYGFDVVDDLGEGKSCTEKQSVHLFFQDWIIKEREQ